LSKDRVPLEIQEVPLALREAPDAHDLFGLSTPPRTNLVRTGAYKRKNPQRTLWRDFKRDVARERPARRDDLDFARRCTGRDLRVNDSRRIVENRGRYAIE
jgi:hypothetical protein